MERVVVGRSFTLSKTFYEDGVPTNPDAPPSVTVTRTDGVSSVVGSDSEPDPGTWSITVPASENQQLDTLTISWAAEIAGESQEYVDTVEVAGDVLFTISEFRALGTAYANTTNYPTATVADMRTTVEQALEDACGVAFVPRYELESFSGLGKTTTILRWPRVTAVRSVTIDDTAVTPVSDVVALREGLAYYSSGWTAGYGNVQIGYEHGHSSPPMRVKRAALLLAKRWITPGAADDRAINMSNETGTYALFQAGVRGHSFDIPEVQATVDQYSLKVGVA